jgi:hypothetical protein
VGLKATALSPDDELVRVPELVGLVMNLVRVDRGRKPSSEPAAGAPGGPKV